MTFIPRDVTLNVVIQSAIMLSVPNELIMLSVVMLSVIVLNVGASKDKPDEEDAAK